MRITGVLFWKSILLVLHEVSDNVKVLVRGGNAYFWYDMWLASEPLSVQVEEIINTKLWINEFWLDVLGYGTIDKTN